MFWLERRSHTSAPPPPVFTRTSTKSDLKPPLLFHLDLAVHPKILVVAFACASWKYLKFEPRKVCVVGRSCPGCVCRTTVTGLADAPPPMDLPCFWVLSNKHQSGVSSAYTASWTHSVWTELLTDKAIGFARRRYKYLWKLSSETCPSELHSSLEREPFFQHKGTDLSRSDCLWVLAKTGWNWVAFRYFVVFTGPGVPGLECDVNQISAPPMSEVGATWPPDLFWGSEKTVTNTKFMLLQLGTRWSAVRPASQRWIRIFATHFENETTAEGKKYPHPHSPVSADHSYLQERSIRECVRCIHIFQKWTTKVFLSSSSFVNVPENKGNPERSAAHCGRSKVDVEGWSGTQHSAILKAWVQVS